LLNLSEKKSGAGSFRTTDGDENAAPTASVRMRTVTNYVRQSRKRKTGQWAEKPAKADVRI
jgi:hypothetical protein